MVTFSGETVLDGTTSKLGNDKILRAFPVLLRIISGSFIPYERHMQTPLTTVRKRFEKKKKGGVGVGRLESPVVSVSVGSTLRANQGIIREKSLIKL